MVALWKSGPTLSEFCGEGEDLFWWRRLAMFKVADPSSEISPVPVQLTGSKIPRRADGGYLRADKRMLTCSSQFLSIFFFFPGEVRSGYLTRCLPLSSISSDPRFP